MSLIRTFLALPLPDSLQRYLSQMLVPILDSRDHINWVKPGNIHITLNYLGDTEEAAMEVQALEIAKLVAGYPAFELGTTATGVFPHANDPRVLWVGAAPYDAQLLAFKADLDQLLKQFRYSIDIRKFQPHITLGRVKTISRNSSFLHDYLVTDVREAIFTVESVKWLQSTLTPAGAIYEERFNFKFKQGESA